MSYRQDFVLVKPAFSICPMISVLKLQVYSEIRHGYNNAICRKNIMFFFYKWYYYEGGREWLVSHFSGLVSRRSKLLQFQAKCSVVFHLLLSHVRLCSCSLALPGLVCLPCPRSLTALSRFSPEQTHRANSSAQGSVNQWKREKDGIQLPSAVISAVTTQSCLAAEGKEWQYLNV